MLLKAGYLSVIRSASTIAPRLNSTGFFMFHGSIVALVTPMNDHGKIDFEAYQRLIDLHLSSATNCIVVAGTTGESASLSQSEFCQLLKLAVEQVDSKIPVLAGTGSPDTARAVSKTRLAAELGADGALVVTPYYNRPMQSGLLAHMQGQTNPFFTGGKQ